MRRILFCLVALVIVAVGVYAGELDGKLVGRYALDKRYLFPPFPPGYDARSHKLFLAALREGAAKEDLYPRDPSLSFEQNIAIEYDVFWALSRDFNKKHAALAFTLAKVGRWSDAAAAFRKAVKETPSSAGSWGSLGVATHVLGLYQESISAFTQAMSIDPTYLDSREIQRRIQKASSEHRRVE